MPFNCGFTCTWSEVAANEGAHEWRGVDLGSGCTGLEAMCGNCEQLALVWWQCHKPQVLFAVKCSIHDSWGVGSICSPQNFGLRHSASYLCSSRTGLLLMKLYPWSAKCLARWPSSTKSPSILGTFPNYVSVSALRYYQHLYLNSYFPFRKWNVKDAHYKAFSVGHSCTHPDMDESF